MNRAVATIILLSLVLTGKGQPASADITVRNYSAAQKRLLLISTSQFINLFAQNNLDPDSAMSIASRITGLPFTLPYDDRINSNEEMQIRSLLEKGMAFLYRTGTHKTDLDNAKMFISEAVTLSINGKYRNWENECRFLEGELSAQRGDTSKSRKIYTALASQGQETQDTLLSARAYERLGTLLPTDDSMKLTWYRRSLELYQKKAEKEKTIELLWNVAFSRYPLNLGLVESSMKQILQLEQSTSFKHSLYAKYILSFVCVLKARYVDALIYSKAVLEDLQWSGMNALSAPCLTRVGAAYEGFGDEEEALTWFRKALATRSRDTRLFWYKSLIYLAELLTNVNKARESLETINSIVGDYPPITIWENLQILSLKGRCYEMLNEPKSADVYYMDLFALMTKFPNADPHAELVNTFYQIGEFYVSQGNLKKARQFQQLPRLSDANHFHDNYDRYSLLFKIDSAEKNYRSAMLDHILYKYYADSITRIDQQKKMGELTLAYMTAKKDKDIALLKQQAIVQQDQLKQNRLTRNIMIGGSASLLLIAGLLFIQFKSKQRANRVINKKNALLQHLVGEKEWLLKEVHHRVKNNLHTVICLLESQARHLENDALKAIEVSQHRIYAMSLIHQKLYQSEDIKLISMASYIPELVWYLDSSFGVTGKISFRLDIDPIKLGVAFAIPIGLIINEGVTNSIKYAFPGGERGLVSITMKQMADTISLTIADNGIGMDPANARMNSGSLGIKLINGLIEDLNGQTRFETVGGTKIMITFPADQMTKDQEVYT